MMPKLIQSVMAITLMASLPALSFAASTNSSEKTNLEQSSQGSLVEIANIQVFKEICPELVGANKNLSHGLSQILSSYLPGFDDPQLALDALNQEDYYQPILKQARQEVAQASQEDNRQVCLSIINWDKKQK
jgi:hypothetical protein